MLHFFCCIPVFGGVTCRITNILIYPIVQRSKRNSIKVPTLHISHLHWTRIRPLALDKDPSTISKEVKTHLSVETVGAFRMKYNACTNRFRCQKSRICHPCRAERHYKLCRRCGLCNAFCSDFVPYDCPRLKRPPYVCNGCGSRPECTLKKHFYHAQFAHNDYLSLLSESRRGISFSEDELRHIDEIVSPLTISA